MDSVELDFRQRVETLVSQIPEGRVMTYGQLAALCGSPRAARIVGGIAHFGDPNLPWQRVVNKQGGMATGYPGGRRSHAEHLRLEGIEFDEDLHVINMQTRIWWPSNDELEQGNVL